MALAEVVYTGVGGTQAYTITFPFLAQSHIVAKVNGVTKTLGVDYTINAPGTTLTFIGAVVIANGDRIFIDRVTPRLGSQRLVDFTNGSTLTAFDLDTSALQLLYIVQEAFDDTDNALKLTTDGTDVWDGKNKEITNLGEPLAPHSAIRQMDLAAAIIATGNLPAVTVGDNDSSLFVVAGAWTIRTLAQIKTLLGLGTAAFLNVGVGANQVVQFSGATQYPAADGRLIDLTNNPTVAAPPTLAINFVNQGVINNVSVSWNTDAAGITGRHDITLGSNTKWNDPTNAINVSLVNDLVQLAVGTYEVDINLVYANTGGAATSQVDSMFCDAAGTSVISFNGFILGAVLAGATWSGLQVIQRKVLLTVGVVTQYALKARHNNAGGSVFLVGNGSSLVIRKIA